MSDHFTAVLLFFISASISFFALTVMGVPILFSLVIFTVAFLAFIVVLG